MFLSPFNKKDADTILENFEIFKRDYLDSIKEDNFFDYNSIKTGINDMIDQPSKKNSNWQVCPIWFKFEPWPQKEHLESNEVIRKLQIKPLQAGFSKLLPNTVLPWHEDHDESIVHRYDTTIVKYHLTLTSPKNGESGLELKGKESRILREGDLNIFDESMTHRAWNKGDQERGVLLISYLRADLDV